MSRRPAAGADRAAQNAQTLKALVKLEGNKVCADCKRNKHPRWASWNLGVFVCIRCSGIHRGMGTHISRVKSVDLDAWTDEQLQSVLKWGNTRANKYWEAKLAPGHVPSEAKMENFIRTKYESKRWVMDGPMPDPATLDAEGDDEVPLNLVQEKAKIERSTSQRLQEPSKRAPPKAQPAPAVDLFGDFSPAPPPVRPSTADIPDSRPTRSGPAPVTAKPSQPQRDSLLGLDFFGGSQGSGIGRPSSAASNPSATSRGDLKNSILSLYASAPKPQPATQTSHERQPSFGAVASPPAQRSDAFGGLADAFGGLDFSSTTSRSPEAPQSTSAFTGISGFQSTTAPKSPPMASTAFGAFPTAVPNKTAPSAPQVSSPPPLSGGNFFDMSPKSPPVPKSSNTAPRQPSTGLDFAFTQNLPAAPAPGPAPKRAPVSIPTDLFAADDFGGFASSTPASPPKALAPAPALAPKPARTTASTTTAQTSDFSSAFNLSTPQPMAPNVAVQPPRTTAAVPSTSAMFDPWGSGADSSPWGAPEPVPAKAKAPSISLGSVPAHITPNDITGGWGAPASSAAAAAAAKSPQQPTVAADEDFGGWTSASTTQTPAATAPPKSAGGGAFGGASDPFDNPWG